jgi:hypothetical protein
MNLGKAARHFAVIPLLALVILGGALVGAPGQVWRALWGPLAARQDHPVIGRATRNGEPVPNVTLQFHSPDGRVVTVKTDDQGRYEVKLPEGGKVVVVEPLPEGADQIAVEAVLPRTMAGGGRPTLLPVVKIPMREAQQATHLPHVD